MTKKLTMLLLFILFSLSWIYAGNTGKVSGTVTDAESGEPLIGANVLIGGTTMGASVDVDGFYFILNVPPGSYTVVSSMVGYSKVSQTEVRVSADKTTSVNFQLSLTSIMGEEVVVVAANPVVKRDVSQSEITSTKEDIEVVPLVMDVASYMALQSGVELERDVEGQEMYIRGGGGTQIGMVVDGLTMTNNIGGGPINVVNLSAIEEVTIIKGGFNAEYGNIRSGLFNIVTKEGGLSYGGSIDARYTPAQQKHRGANLYSHENFYLRPYLDPSVAWVGTQNGDWDAYTQGQFKQFEGWNAFTEKLNSDDNPDNDMTPQEAQNLYIWQHAAEGAAALGHPHEGSYGDEPDHNLDLSLSGYVPGLDELLTFFISFRNNVQQYPNPSQLNGVYNQTGMIKLNSRFNPSMKLGLEYMSNARKIGGGGNEGEGGGDRGSYFPHGSTPGYIDEEVFGITWDHVLSNSTFYKIRASYIQVANDFNHARTYRNTTPLATFGGVTVDEQPYGWLNDPGYVYAVADEMVIGGVGGSWFDQTTVKTINVKFDMTSQLDRYNQVQAGIEIIRDEYEIYLGNAGFDPTGDFVNDWAEKPLRAQGYIQDKLEFEGFIANIGVRFDYNDPNAKYYGVDPYSKYFSRPYKSLLTTEGNSVDADGHFVISPRLGVAHPITEKSKLYFNYGHFFSTANAFNSYEIDYGIDNEGIASLGNPQLKPERTIAYELGYEQEIAEEYLLRLTGYYRDITEETAGVQYINYDESVNYNSFTNQNYGDTRGFEIELRKDWGRWVTGWVNYTYMVESSGQIGREVQYQDPRKQVIFGLRNPDQNKPLPQPRAFMNFRVMSPSGWGPTLGDVAFLDRISLNFLVSWETGDYLTWEPVGDVRNEENNLQWEDRWNVDLRISKAFSAANFEFNLFFDISNVLDLTYLTGNGFHSDADYRDYMNSLHLPMYSEEKYQSAGIYTAGDDQVGNVRSDDKPYINMPNMDFQAWNAPRTATLGIMVSF